MNESEPHLSGGCQCGAVRFRVRGTPGDSSICHCRMCQKASAAVALALVNVRDARLEWTRGEPAWFASSNAARRGFCRDCGTPLAYDAPDGLALSLMAFDHPEAHPPTKAWGLEGKQPFADGLASLPGGETLDDAEAASFLRTLVNLQHPDHDTDHWPP